MENIQEVINTPKEYLIQIIEEHTDRRNVIYVGALQSEHLNT